MDEIWLHEAILSIAIYSNVYVLVLRVLSHWLPIEPDNAFLSAQTLVQKPKTLEWESISMMRSDSKITACKFLTISHPSKIASHPIVT